MSVLVGRSLKRGRKALCLRCSRLFSSTTCRQRFALISQLLAQEQHRNTSICINGIEIEVSACGTDIQCMRSTDLKLGSTRFENSFASAVPNLALRCQPGDGPVIGSVPLASQTASAQ